MNVSIIIPCYNSGWVLEPLSRNLQPFVEKGAEIIFVDDGSKDGSLEKFLELVPSAHCLSQQRRGPGAARNLGARQSTRKYLRFLDADDTIEQGNIEAQIAELEREGLDAVYSDWQMVIVNGEKVTREPLVRAQAPGDLIDSMLGGWWVPSNACLVTRSVYWSLGGHDESLHNLEDFDFWLRLAIQCRTFAYVPGHAASYYRYLRVQSRARGSRMVYWKSREAVFNRALKELSAQNELSMPRRRAAARQLHLTARNVFEFDRVFFDRVIRRVYELDPQFRPQGSLSYRVAARVLGLASAERISTLTRPLRLLFDARLRMQYVRLGSLARG